jgi:hypothetical protein
MNSRSKSKLDGPTISAADGAFAILPYAGTPNADRIEELLQRRHDKPWPTLGPRAFGLRLDDAFSLTCDPDTPLEHDQPVVVVHDKVAMFWALLKTKNPGKARVLQIGWPGQRADFRYRKGEDGDWIVAPVVLVWRTELMRLADE